MAKINSRVRKSTSGSQAKRSTSTPKKSSNRVRIHNPVTNSYYQVRKRSTSAGKKGTIIGKWSNKTQKKKK